MPSRKLRTDLGDKAPILAVVEVAPLVLLPKLLSRRVNLRLRSVSNGHLSEGHGQWARRARLTGLLGTRETHETRAGSAGPISLLTSWFATG
jgi:hypothetical protein